MTDSKAIDNVREALAMREAGYAALPAPDDVAALLWAYDVCKSAGKTLAFKLDEARAALTAGKCDD
jgi:hypothetical protein